MIPWCRAVAGAAVPLGRRHPAGLPTTPPPAPEGAARATVARAAPTARLPLPLQVCKSGRLASTVTLPEILSLQVRPRTARAPPPDRRWVGGVRWYGRHEPPAPPLNQTSAPRSPPLQHLPIELAAAEVGVCVTTFKKVSPRVKRTPALAGARWVLAVRRTPAARRCTHAPSRVATSRLQ